MENLDIKEDASLRDRKKSYNSTSSESREKAARSIIPQRATQSSARKDVIYKTIFRFMRKFYVRRFKEYFDFTKMKNRASGIFEEKVDSYVTTNFPSTELSNLKVFFNCVVDTKASIRKLVKSFQL